MKGILVAAPFSGSGKTTITLGLLRAFANAGVAVAAAKAGPDYIDTAFQALASRNDCINLDPWAMRSDYLSSLADQHAGGELLIVEAMMGLFDGSADGTGSPADLAAHLGLPVILVVDCGRMSQSVAALVKGYSDHRSDLTIAGVVLNRVGSLRHERMLRTALEPTGIPVFGVVPTVKALALPSRHLGLVQASEHADIETMIEHAARIVAESVDIDAIRTLASGRVRTGSAYSSPLPPIGQNIAVARDHAFAFSYPHMLNGWRDAGAALSFFSPLADEEVPTEADAVFLPGGYPELHAGQIAGASRFLDSLRAAAARGAYVYGECGGYMVLGEGLTDADGARHRMSGLLALETSYASPKRHLGYRRIRPLSGDSAWAFAMTGHEFHYSAATKEVGDALFAASDAEGSDLGNVGLRAGNVCGSYLHVIDRADQ